MRILIQNRQRKYPLNERQIRRWVRNILKMQKEEDAEISLVFVNNRTIRKYNKEFRGQDKPTDVLSFPMRDVRAMHARPIPALELPLLGDIMISLEKTYEEAPLFQHGPSEHLLFLIIHGILHLLGYDHEQSRAEEARMKRQEKKILEAVYRPRGRKRVPRSSP